MERTDFERTNFSVESSGEISAYKPDFQIIKIIQNG